MLTAQLILASNLLKSWATGKELTDLVLSKTFRKV